MLEQARKRVESVLGRWLWGPDVVLTEAGGLEGTPLGELKDSKREGPTQVGFRRGTGERERRTRLQAVAAEGRGPASSGSSTRRWGKDGHLLGVQAWTTISIPGERRSPGEGNGSPACHRINLHQCLSRPGMVQWGHRLLVRIWRVGAPV